MLRLRQTPLRHVGSIQAMASWRQTFQCILTQKTRVAGSCGCRRSTLCLLTADEKSAQEGVSSVCFSYITLFEPCLEFPTVVEELEAKGWGRRLARNGSGCDSDTDTARCVQLGLFVCRYQ